MDNAGFHSTNNMCMILILYDILGARPLHQYTFIQNLIEWGALE